MNTVKLAWLARVKKRDKSTLNAMVSKWHGENYIPFLGDPVFCAIQSLTVFAYSFFLLALCWVGGIWLYFSSNIFTLRIILSCGVFGILVGLVFPVAVAWCNGSQNSFRYFIWMWQRARGFCQVISLLEKRTGAKFNLDWSDDNVKETAIAVLKQQAQKVKGFEGLLEFFDKEHESDCSWEKPYSRNKREKIKDELENERREFKVMFRQLKGIAEIPANCGFYYGEQEEETKEKVA